jgi:hypothetical protein
MGSFGKDELYLTKAVAGGKKPANLTTALEKAMSQSSVVNHR